MSSKCQSNRHDNLVTDFEEIECGIWIPQGRSLRSFLRTNSKSLVRLLSSLLHPTDNNLRYFEELFELLRDNHGEGYFVTDIVTLTNLETTDETTRKKGAGAGAQVPLDPSFGVDVHAKGSFHVVREKGYSACYEEEAIVFLGYRRIKLEKVTGARARLERVFLGQKHGFTVRDGVSFL